MFFKYKTNKQYKKIIKEIDHCDEQLLFLNDFKFPEKLKATMSFLWHDYWNLYVPKQGQSNVLQAEILRRVEKLQYESTNNGNINWDSNFSYFCDWLLSTFESFEELKPYIYKINIIITKLKYHGCYASIAESREFSDKYFNVNYIACCDEKIYSYLYMMVCIIYETHKQDIYFQVEEEVYR